MRKESLDGFFRIRAIEIVEKMLIVGPNPGWQCPKTGHFISTNADFTCSLAWSTRKRDETVSHAGEIFLSAGLAFYGWQRASAIAVREQY
jgi:hypothetical protein